MLNGNRWLEGKIIRVRDKHDQYDVLLLDEAAGRSFVEKKVRAFFQSLTMITLFVLVLF